MLSIQISIFYQHVMHTSRVEGALYNNDNFSFLMLNTTVYMFFRHQLQFALKALTVYLQALAHLHGRSDTEEVNLNVKNAACSISREYNAACSISRECVPLLL